MASAYTAVAAAADYFFDTWWRAVGSVLLFNTFPIDRRGGSMAATPRGGARRRVEPGDYPEGTRSTDGWIGKFRMGAAFLAKGTGSRSSRSRTAARSRRCRAAPTARPDVGSSRSASASRSSPASTVRRQFAPRIKDAVAALLDEDRTTWWESRRRVAAGATPDPSGPSVAAWRRVWEQTESPASDPPSSDAPGGADHRLGRSWRPPGA